MLCPGRFIFWLNLYLNFFTGPYGKFEADKLDRLIRDHLDVKEKHVLVVGSQSPWIEVMALRNGAKKVTTLEYTKIISEDPRIESIEGHQFMKMYQDKSMPEFDAVISFSSVEHSGLGR